MEGATIYRGCYSGAIDNKAYAVKPLSRYSNPVIVASVDRVCWYLIKTNRIHGYSANRDTGNEKPALAIVMDSRTKEAREMRGSSLTLAFLIARFALRLWFVPAGFPSGDILNQGDKQMADLRCNCNEHKPLIMKYTDTKVEGKCRKCKKILSLEVVDGKLQEVKDGKEETETKETETKET